MERLTHNIPLVVQQGLWKPVQISRGDPLLSRLFFADDLILFAYANNNQMDVISGVLQDFCECSGQRVNFDKIVAFFQRIFDVQNPQVHGIAISNTMISKISFP